MNGIQGKLKSECAQSVKRPTLTKKKCPKCGKTKLLKMFYNNSSRPDGKHSYCGKCERELRKISYQKNTERERQEARDSYQKNKKRYNESNKLWRKSNPEKAKQSSINCRLKKPEKYRRLHRELCRRLSKKPKNKLNSRMSIAINRALKGQKAGRHWEYLVGYQLSDLKKHIEKQFKTGMSWDNIGEWHIDHVIPKMVFNYEKPEDDDFRRCWALKNLQPLWAIQNCSKGAKIDKPFQPSLIFQTGTTN